MFADTVWHTYLFHGVCVRLSWGFLAGEEEDGRRNADVAAQV